MDTYFPLEDLPYDALEHVFVFLSLGDIGRAAQVSHTLKACAYSDVVWRPHLFRKYTASSTITPERVLSMLETFKVGSFRGLYHALHTTQVYSWGRSSGRTGRATDWDVPGPVPGLAGKQIRKVGKSHEVGSVAMSVDGVVYQWGGYGSVPIAELPMSTLSTEEGDFAVDVSYGHNTGLAVVMNSGRVHLGKARELADWNLPPLERPILCLGSQSRCSGALTNRGRLLLWTNYGTGESIVPPPQVDGVDLEIIRVGQSHKIWFAITADHRLFEYIINNDGKTWTPVADGRSDIVDADGGTEHYGFLTEDGNAYMWGANSFFEWGVGKIACARPSLNPVLVDYFPDRGLKVVRLALGGFAGWSGGFSLFLTECNRLFVAGTLGKVIKAPYPVEIDANPRLGGRPVLDLMGGEDWAALVVAGAEEDSPEDVDADEQAAEEEGAPVAEEEGDRLISTARAPAATETTTTGRAPGPAPVTARPTTTMWATTTDGAVTTKELPTRR